MANVGAINISVNYNVNSTSLRNVNNSINSLRNQAPKLQSVFTSAFAKVGTAIKNAFSVDSIVNFSKEALNLASNLQEVQNVVEVTFGEMAGTVDSFAKSAIFNLGMSETSAKRYTGAFGAMAKSAGFTTEEATRLSMSITALSADVASLYNYDYETVYNKMKSIFTGMTAPLRELGVDITQAALDQWALAKGYAKTTAEMTQQERVALRYSYVVDKLSLAQGDFARTQDNWANQTRILKDQISTFMTNIGNGLLVVLSPAIQALNDFMSKLNQVSVKFVDFVSMITGKKLQTTDQSRAEAQVAAIGLSATESSEELSDLADGYETAGKAAKKATESLASFDNVVQLSNPSSSDKSSGVGDYTAFEDYKWVDTVELKEADTIFDSWTSKLEKIKEILTNFFDTTSVGKAAKNFIQSYAQALITGAKSLVGVGKSIIESIIGGMVKYIEDEKYRISDQWTEIFNNFSSWYDDMGLLLYDLGALLSNFFSLEDTKASIANSLAAVEGFITGTYLFLSGIGAEIERFVSKTIDDNFSELNDFFTNTSALLEKVTRFIKNVVLDCFQSVYSTFDKYIRPAFEQFQEGFSFAFGKVVEVWNSYIHPLLGEIAEGFNRLWDNHLKAFVDEVLGMAGAIIEAVASIYKHAIKPFVAYWKLGWKLISPILESLWGRIEGLVGDIIDILTGLTRKIKGIFEVISGICQGDGEKVKEGLINIFKGTVQQVSAVFSLIINQIIDGLNVIIKAANKIKIPGTDVGVNLQEIKRWSAPKLADGGIVYRETNFGNFIAGEAGAEAIVPLENSEYTRILAREIVRGMVEAGMGGDTYNISTAYLDKRGLEKLTQEINGVNKQLGARKGVIAYG